ncbi:HAMP domain-containing protein [Desulfatitalea alkaliphila]|uniref:HAMP domain-containing protein n=1 Tax=Desulfatitalea alkaliphila TaxID=2929485 RepID=A0AA41UK39_9BACT|nr:HAMP domain-containing protein [Desulfatitalea alkaliphila]MCJ8499996.1 HAMP domain-containing protein [Desulfatitalea alkaliphila]
MKKRSGYSLQRTMIIYFLLIGFAAAMVGVEFLVDFHRGALKTEIWDNIRLYGLEEQHQEAIFAPIDRMRSKALLMVVIILMVSLIVLIMFIKYITEPLQHMIDLARKISGGDLSRTIRIHSDNELAELGGVINEMASNLQEIILLSQGTCANGRELTRQARQELTMASAQEDRLRRLTELIDRLEQELALLEEVITYFRFYSVEGRHAAG